MRCALFLLLLALACATTKASPEPPRLSDPTKADDGGIEVFPLGAIAYGGEVSGELVLPDHFDAYTFNAFEDAVVTLDNTQRGTAAALDSVLYVYGPADDNGFFGADPIAIDDDAGWGAHARLRDLTLPATGQYLAVLGLAKDALPGRYRLTLDDDDISDNGSMDDLEEAVLRRWHEEDPVDAWEMRRNNRIEALQGNRNPFIDRPEIVERIENF